MLCFWVIVGCSALVAGIPLNHQANQDGAEFRLSGLQISKVEGARGSPGVARGESRDSKRVARGVQPGPGGAAELTQQQGASEGRQEQGEERAVSGDIARILRIAGTKPVAVDPSGSYSGRKKRSESLDLTAGEAPVPAEGQLVVQQGQEEGGRNFGNIARILQIAGTKPKPVDLTGSYSGRRKRDSPLDLGRPTGLEDIEDRLEDSIPSDRYQDSFLFGRETERRKRSNKSQDLHGLVPNVAVQAVKVKSHGKYGNVAQVAVDGAPSSRTIFEAQLGRRRRRSNNFIPFSEYDQRRVKTLKIEQNDFLALPQRLHLEKQNEAERRKRKFQLS